jgi:hypothetical protein
VQDGSLLLTFLTRRNVTRKIVRVAIRGWHREQFFARILYEVLCSGIAVDDRIVLHINNKNRVIGVLEDCLEFLL